MIFSSQASALPLPSFEMRQLVGPTEDQFFDNPTGKLIIPEVPESFYESFFDFGCGCGRIARQLLQQKPRPKKYVGIDLHPGMINWCKKFLAPHDSNFKFLHHDVYNVGFNNDLTKPHMLNLP